MKYKTFERYSFGWVDPKAIWGASETRGAVVQPIAWSTDVLLVGKNGVPIGKYPREEGEALCKLLNAAGDE